MQKFTFGYLLHGKRQKRENFFRQNEILLYAEIQRKFTYLPIQTQLMDKKSCLSSVCNYLHFLGAN